MGLGGQQQSQTRQTVSIVAPVFNEEAGIGRFVESLQSVLKPLEDSFLFEVILVNDGSKDESLNVMKRIAQSDQRIQIIHFLRNFGHQAAIIAGMDQASGDCIITLDSDLQDPPELIPQFLEHWKNGYHHVAGRRVDRSQDSLFKRSTAAAFYSLQRAVSDFKPLGNVADYRLVSRSLWLQLKRDESSTHFLRGSLAWSGVPTVLVDYSRPARETGETNYSLRKMLRLARNGLVFTSLKPLRIARLFAVLFGATAMLYATYILTRIVFGHTRPPTGYSSLMILGLVGFASVSLMLSILGSYVARIFEIQLRRPPYLAEFYSDCDDLEKYQTGCGDQPSP